MTKLSALAITILLLLGAAMWYTANLSYPEFIKQQVSVRGKALTGKNIQYDKFIENSAELSGKFLNVSIIENNKNIINFTEIHYTINKESLEEPIIVIEQLSFINLTTDKQATSVISEVISNLQKATINIENKNLPKITIKEILLIDKKTQAITKIMTAEESENKNIILLIKLALLEILLNTQKAG